MRVPTVIPILAASLVLIASLSSAGTSKKIKVKCDKGDSINEALMNDAEELIIQISGFCQEHVVIARDNVTLRGSDPASDGIEGEGPTDEPVFRALVWVDSARSDPQPSGIASIILENLTLRRSPTRGLETTGGRTNVELKNCRLVVNGRGIQVSHGFVYLEDSFIESEYLPLVAWSGATLRCHRCTVAGEYYLALTVGGRIHLTDSSLSTAGGEAMFAAESGRIWGTNSSVEAPWTSIYATEIGEIWWEGGEISGSIWADTKSLVKLVDVEQTENPEGNYITEDSTLLLESSTLVGGTSIVEFSNGTLKNDSTLGNLYCDSGGDLWCDGSETKTSSTCGLCP